MNIANLSLQEKMIYQSIAKKKHNEYYFNCNDCRKGFNAKTHLMSHMEEHGIFIENMYYRENGMIYFSYDLEKTFQQLLLFEWILIFELKKCHFEKVYY